MPSLRVLLVFVIAVALPAFVLATETLCSPGEAVYFSCKIKGTGQLVSLCGNALVNPERFWLQYRFGRPEELELAYPPKRTLFSRASFDVGYFRRANGFDADVTFTNGGWSYTVFHWVPGEGDTTYKSGVFVARNRAGPGTTLNCITNPNLGRNSAFSRLAQMYGKD